MRFDLDGRIGALRGQGCLRSNQRRHLHQIRNDSGPPSLMTRAQSRSILTMEILGNWIKSFHREERHCKS